MSIYKSSSLAMLPTAYKDGKLYSVRPTDGSGDFTFSRGSNLAATRVASSGYIEKGRENRLLQSNTFSNASWTKFNSNVTSGQADKDGGTEAWKIDLTAAAGRLVQNITTGGVQTISVYAKAGTLDWVRILVTAGSSRDRYFDLSTGVLGGTTYGGEIDSKIESVGNGWYRCSITFNETLATFRIYPAQGDGNLSATSGNIYIQDAQLEQGLVATDYIETGASTAQAGILEDLPRLDYSGGASCPSLLLEPQRSNLVDDYSGYTWDSFNGAAISFTGTERSPEGFANAVTWTFGGSSGEVVQRSSISISNSTTYTISGYFKLTSGTLTSGSNQIKGLDGLSGGSVSLNTLTDEWQRLTFSVTSSSTSGRVQLRCDNSATIQVYGLQLESGSYETSVIPTYGSAVTRSLDSCLATSVSDLIGQEQGTMFFEIDQPYADGVNGAWSISDGSSTNRLTMNTLDVNTTTFTLSIATNYAGGSTKLASVNKLYGLHKVAIQYSGTTLKLFVDGALADSVTTDGFGNYTNFYIGANQAGVGDEIREFKQAVLFPTALTDSECIALTTI